MTSDTDAPWPPAEPAGTMDMSTCAWCGQAKARHEQMEAAGEVQHRWSATTHDGLTPVESGASQRAGAGPQVIVAPAPDILLRQLLLELGVITQEQYDGLRRA